MCISHTANITYIFQNLCAFQNFYGTLRFNHIHNTHQQNVHCSSLDIYRVLQPSVFVHVSIHNRSSSGKKYQIILHITKRKGHPRKGYEGLEGEYKYSLTLSLTSALDGGGWSTPRPGRFTPWERPGTHCTEGWVGPRAGLDECGKSRPHRDLIPGPSRP